MRTGIDLFAGIGGFSLAMQMNGIEVIEQVEIEPYPIKVLEKNFPGAKRHGDIRTYKPNANPWIVCGGFPCQDISSAGKGAGLSGKRSSLWWEMHRVIDESRPDWVLIENVSALRVRGDDAVLLSLEELGYSSRAFLVGASDIKASHQRKRVWIAAHRVDAQQDFSARQDWKNDQRPESWWPELRSGGHPRTTALGYNGRVDDGLRNRMDRVKMLGNAVVPMVAYQVLQALVQPNVRAERPQTAAPQPE